MSSVMGREGAGGFSLLLRSGLAAAAGAIDRLGPRSLPASRASASPRGGMLQHPLLRPGNATLPRCSHVLATASQGRGVG